ncbi:cytochrome c-type biogenesis protein CcmH/NrfG [Okibacterium sp. HSC-33S16]|uniref:SHOCT domain-containing protein n=1 Tax=Okibacterium sp. HSC-33S16 TaxID=2910965 RepID=UPI00209F648E|nr:SHOCT domain-containing protein [Okibacterium sp. HSC-33S16]MCP2031009.1 cytochrome c-type biogenesis protein CcmH/NrfG [Okibacterium sp. HSC-33S16]
MNLIVDFLWVLATLAAVIFVVVGIVLVVLAVRHRRTPPASAATGRPTPTNQSVPVAHTARERLQELEALRAAGTITPEEHAARRDAILGEL